MLETNQPSSTDDSWSDLKSQARTLMDRIEAGDLTGASDSIEGLNQARDHGFYREVGKLTRGLHEAITNFDIDTSDNDAESKMANAQDRLDYVINLTQSSADKTMDMVEEGIPLAAEIGEQAEALQSDWQRLLNREMEAGEFRDLYKRMDSYLKLSSSNSTQLSEKLNAILLAQDYQDLTGQVIQKVISLVQDVEERLVELIRVASHVEELTGIVHTPEETAEKAPVKKADSSPEGPQIHADKRDDVVSGQDDVDDLLSSLGF